MNSHLVACLFVCPFNFFVVHTKISTLNCWTHKDQYTELFLLIKKGFWIWKNVTSHTFSVIYCCGTTWWRSLNIIWVTTNY